MYDIIIIGAGPAGMTAAIYASQARKKVLIIEKEVYGGQIIKASKVRNYPGFNEISGVDFSTNLYNQVKENNVDVKFEEVVSIKNNDKEKAVITRTNTYKSKCIIIATGAKSKKLNLENEDNLIGKGVSYCSTCDGMFFKGKDVAIIGGGNSAVDDAIYLSNICNKVYFIYRKGEFKSEVMNSGKLKENKNVEFEFNSEIIKLTGKEKLENITLKNNVSNEEKIINVEGLFIAIGHIPVSLLCNDKIDSNKSGYIISNEYCKTNIDGVFAAGDVREKQIRQLTTATSDGTVAAINAISYLNKQKA